MKLIQSLLATLSAFAIGLNSIAILSGAEAAAPIPEGITENPELQEICQEAVDEYIEYSSEDIPILKSSYSPTVTSGTVEITLEELEASNYQVKVPVSVSDSWSDLGCGFRYDTTKLTCEEISSGPTVIEGGDNGWLIPFGKAINKNNGVGWFGLSVASSASASTGETVYNYIEAGAALNLTFAVNADAVKSDLKSSGDGTVEYTIQTLNDNGAGVTGSISTPYGKSQLPATADGAVIVKDTMFTTTQTTTRVTTTTQKTTTTTTTTANSVYSGECGDNLIWVLKEGMLTISGTGEMYDYEYISSSQPTTAPWFKYRSSIKSIIIRNGVTKIGEEAFDSCQNVVSVTIPDSVTTIGIYAFDSCKSLTTVKLPDYLDSISYGLFARCSNINSIIIPESVTSIDDYAFTQCDSLKSIRIENPSCMIYSSSDAICSGATIYGYRGSTAETYADMYSRDFVSIDNYSSGAKLSCGTVELTLDELKAADYYVTVPITLTGSNGWRELGCGLSFDTEKLRCTNVVTGEELVMAALDEGSQIIQAFGNNKEFGKIWSGSATLGVGSDAYWSPDGVVLNVTFKVSESAESGDMYSLKMLASSNGTDCILTTKDGSFTPALSDGAIIIKETETTNTTTSTTYVTTTTYTTTRATTTSTQKSENLSSAKLSCGTVELTLDELRAADYYVTVPITLTGSYGWRELGYGFTFDISMLTCSKAATGTELVLAALNKGCQIIQSYGMNNEKGIFWTGACTLGIGSDIYWSSDGVVLNVTFKVSESAKSGDIYSLKMLTSSNGTDCTITTKDGSFTPALSDGAIIIKAAETTMTTITTASTTITTVTTTKTSTTDPTDTTTIPSDVLYGDINLDGSISVIDVIYLNKYLAGIIQFNSDQLSSADCVNDNVINSSDATSLLKYTVGKLTTLPVNVAE